MKFDLGQIKELDQQSRQLFIASSVQMLQADNPGMSPMDAAEVVKNTLEVAKSANIQDPSSLQRLVAVSSEHSIAPDRLSPATEKILRDDVLDDFEKVNQAHKQAIYEKEVQEKEPEVTTVEPYPQEKSAELQVKADEELAPMSLPPIPPEPQSSQPCALLAILGDDALDEKKEPEKESEECGFQELQITKPGRDFIYVWDQNFKVKADGQKNVDDYIAIVVGAEKGSKITLSKKGNITCSKHSGNSWRIDGTPQTFDDNEVEVLITAKQTKQTSLEHYLPFRIKPARHSFKAVKCGGWKRLNIHAYPDTEFKLKLNWVLFSTKKNNKYKTDKITRAKSKKTITLNEAKHEESWEQEKEIRTGSIKISYHKDGNEISSIEWKDNGEYKISAAKEATYLGVDLSLGRSEKKEVQKKQDQTDKNLTWSKYAKEIIEGLRSTKKLCQSLNELTVLFGFSKTKNMDWKILILDVSVNFHFRWLELKNSRNCAPGIDLKLNGTMIQAEWKLYISAGNFASLAFPLIKGIVNCVEAIAEMFFKYKFGIQVKVEGNVGVDIDVEYALNHGISWEPAKLSGMVGCTICLLLEGDFTGDYWSIKFGAKGRAEAGTKFKLGDSLSIVSEVKNMVKGEKEQEEMFNLLKPDEPEKWQSKVTFEKGAQAHFFLGHTGAQIYAFYEFSMNASLTAHTGPEYEPDPKMYSSSKPKKAVMTTGLDIETKNKPEEDAKNEHNWWFHPWNLTAWSHTIDFTPSK